MNTDPILIKACEAVGTTPREVRARDRRAEVCDRRHIVFYLMHEANLAFNAIGRLTNHDHGTVIHGIRRIESMVTVEPQLKQQLERALTQFTPQKP